MSAVLKTTVLNTTVLKTTGLESGYNGLPIIRDIDIEVGRGEVVSLLGPNGAGKTTTLMTIAGHLRPLSGQVEVDGRSGHRQLHQRARDGLALVTEKRSVFMRLSVSDNLRLARCDVDHATSLFPELKPLMGRTVGHLSGGEQQILSLARALARKPKVLLADEMSLGLAPKVVTRLLEAVRAAALETGVGVLLVEQHVHQALRYADRVYAMNRGRIVVSGTVEEAAPRLEAAYLDQGSRGEEEPAEQPQES